MNQLCAPCPRWWHLQGVQERLVEQVTKLLLERARQRGTWVSYAGHLERGKARLEGEEPPYQAFLP